MNQIIERKIGDSKDLDFTLNLTNYYGKVGADITDIFFTIKKQKGDADTSLFLKKASAGQITYAGQEIVNVLVKWPYNEYSQFQAKKQYVAGVYPKFSGDIIADENVDIEFDLIFLDDTLKQN